METTATKVDQGQFVWHELVTKDVDEALEFYQHVVGWNAQEYDFEGSEGPPYKMVTAGQVPVGGVMAIDREQMGDVPPHWASYLLVKDVDATMERAKELGGSVFAGPIDVPTVGRMAGIADREGAMIWVMKPATSEPMPDPPLQGSFSWNELATTDYQSGFDFFQKLVGWEKISDMDMGDGWMYLMFGRGEQMWGGAYNKPPEMAEIPPHWLYYINVGDINAALERVKERGGQVLNGPMEIPGGDHVAQCMDPHGAAFALHESKQ